MVFKCILNKMNKNKNIQSNFKILHVAFTLHDPMINQWLIKILRKTCAPHIQIDLMTTADEAPLFESVMNDIGGRLLICPHPKNKGAFLRYMRESLSKSEAPAYDMIHVHPFIMAGDILLQAFRANVPIRLVHAHTDRRKARRDRSWLAKIKYLLAKKLIHQLATHGVASNTQTAANIFGEGWGQDGRWKLMPYGQDIDFDYKKDRGDKVQALKADLSLPPSSKIITQMTPFNFEKNHDLTIRVFEKMARRDLKLRLVLVGQGPLKAKIQNQVLQADLEDRVIFLDELNNDHDILAMTDVLIMPCLYETDVSILIQAQLQGVACLISNEIEQGDYLNNSLMHRLPIEGEIDVWINGLQNILHHDKPDAFDQIEGLKGSPYDIDYNAGKFLGLYHEIMNP